jgi:hypothetical protein
MRGCARAGGIGDVCVDMLNMECVESRCVSLSMNARNMTVLVTVHADVLTLTS